MSVLCRTATHTPRFAAHMLAPTVAISHHGTLGYTMQHAPHQTLSREERPKDHRQNPRDMQQ